MLNKKKAEMSLQKVVALTILLMVFIFIAIYSSKSFSKAHDGISSIKFSSAENICDMNSEKINIFNCDLNECTTDQEKTNWKDYQTYLGDKTCPGTGEVGAEKDKACTCVQQKVWDSIHIEEKTNTVSSLKSVQNTQNNVYTTENKDKIISEFLNPSGELPTKVKTTIDNLKKIDINGKNGYDYVIERSIEKNLDPYLVMAVISQESTGNNYAISPTGCAGLFQFCYSTAFKDSRFSSVFQTSYGCELKSLDSCTCWKDGQKTTEMKCKDDARFNSKLAIDAGIDYLYILSRQFNNDIELILTGYNAGSGISSKCVNLENEKQLECIKTTVSEKYSESKVKEVNTYISNIKSYRIALSDDFSNIYS